MENLNHWLFLMINPSVQPEQLLLDTAKFFAGLPDVLIPLCLIILWFKNHNGKIVALHATITTTLALLANNLIATVWFHNRPFVDHIGLKLISHAADSSFPSDHITFFACVGFFLFYEKSYRYLGLILLILSLATGWARVFVGVHYPFDIIGAYILTSSLTLLYLKYLSCVFSTLINRTIHINNNIYNSYIKKEA